MESGIRIVPPPLIRRVCSSAEPSPSQDALVSVLFLNSVICFLLALRKLLWPLGF